jgi:hypothetical protein
MLVSKKISAKFGPNFAKIGNFRGSRNFGDTEIKSPDLWSVQIQSIFKLKGKNATR